MSLNENPHGYWQGMPSRLKARALGYAIYYLVSAYFALTGHWWGLVLLVLPLLWFTFKSWLMTDVLHIWDTGEQGLAGYTMDYVWGSSIYVRSFIVVSIVAAALGGLGWLGTTDLREEWAKPTVTERVTEAAGSLKHKASDIADATAETSKGWWATAKGWFD